jgi:hypothetical protein
MLERARLRRAAKITLEKSLPVAHEGKQPF